MSRILLVDDDWQVNEVIKASIEIMGHAVETVENGDKALEIISGFKPDFTLIDMMMPGKTGAEVIQDIRRVSPDTITCLTTGLADPGMLEQALDAGAWTLLCKPYNLSDLAELIRTAELLSSALKAEKTQDDLPGESFSFQRSKNEPVNSDDIACLARFAQNRHVGTEVALRKLPIVALELLKNAFKHGAGKTEDGHYGAMIHDLDTSLELRVYDNGAGFDWEKALIRGRMSNDRSRAAGLSLINLLADEFYYDKTGRTACVRFSKELPGSRIA